jgi:hypothetical protein
MAEPQNITDPRPTGPFAQPINSEAQRLAEAPPKLVVRSTGTKPTPATNADSSPQQRWQADQDARAQTDPWLDTSKVLTRDAAGNLVQREAVKGKDGEVIAGKAVDQDESADATAAPTDTGPKVQVGKFEVTEAELEAMLARQSQDDLRKATLPQTPDGYKLELSEGATLPGGAKFEFRPDDPALIAAKNWAHARGLDQATFSEALTLYASHEAQKNSEILAAQAREIAKVGPNAPQRVDSVFNFVRSQMGDADAKMIMRTMVSDAQIRFYEKMITRFTNQGSGSFSRRGNEPDKPGISDAEWDKMTYTQQKDYSERATAAREASARR